MHPVVGKCLRAVGWSNLHGRWLRSRHFPPAVLKQLEQRISESETRHAGELVLAVEQALPDSQPDSLARALEVFGRLRVWDTPQRTGVLLYLCLGDHSIELVADRGVNVAKEDWAMLCASLQAYLARGEFAAGLEMAIAGIETRLEYCCPISDREDSEGLSNAPVVL
ncbi:TPM domain-containing protein [Kerstersia gyiorum]|uniref:TPM domain-containing protein n=1 Tax=Kerstersia gyiorum TaxID=206506 RepID=UPI00242E2B5B|nr:TPM domain-containing protein [Kerstersia gyiorum]MCH4271647.1 TPM domain-containing protein [Kerstersia gyiorum]MCI1229750.1 TPM domain-containing protein [Kerstersia gyiorum]